MKLTGALQRQENKMDEIKPKFSLPDIPKTWIIAAMLVGMIVMRCFGIDTWVTSALSLIIGWLVGVKMEQTRVR